MRTVKANSLLLEGGVVYIFIKKEPTFDKILIFTDYNL